SSKMMHFVAFRCIALHETRRRVVLEEIGGDQQTAMGIEPMIGQSKEGAFQSGRRESNPHGVCTPTDFKSVASAIPPRPGTGDVSREFLRRPTMRNAKRVVGKLRPWNPIQNRNQSSRITNNLQTVIGRRSLPGFWGGCSMRSITSWSRSR